MASPARGREVRPGRSLTPLVPEQGELGRDHDVAALFYDLWRLSVTGRVDLVSGAKRVRLVIEGGVPVHVVSSEVYDRIEEYLLRHGKLTRTQYQELRLKQIEGARQVGSHLVSAGHLKAAELFPAVRGHLVEVVWGLFEWQDGVYQYLPERAVTDDIVALDLETPSLLAEGIRRKYVLSRLVARVGAPSSLLAPLGESAVSVDALGLTPDEASVARLVDGTRSIEDMVHGARLSEELVYRVLTMLLAVGWARVVVRGIEGVDAEGRSTEDAVDRQRIRDRLEQVRELDYFQLLGVTSTATAYELERACDRALEEIGSGRFSAVVQRDLRDELSEITEVLNEARRVLSQEALRGAYARHMA